MNLLLVSVDSLRLDFAPGISKQIHTPRFSSLTGDFHLCQTCFAPSSATRPVHTSLFTGLYPFEHGIEGQHSPAMRQGCRNLFDLCRDAGIDSCGYSQAATIFTGLRFADYIKPLPNAPMAPPAAADANLGFVHYWSVHAPYGAGDGLAFGEVGRQLAAGRLDLVQERYCAAIEELFESHIAPMVASLDLDRWSVFIFSDHGESWRPDEPYHGQTLRNDVLRVPLYYHIPGSGNPPPARDLISLIDLYPTILALMDIDHPYRGYARDIFRSEAPEFYLAEIEPGAMADGPSQPVDLFPPTHYGRQWALFNPEVKFTYDQTTQREERVSTFTEKPLFSLQDHNAYHQAYARMRAASPYMQAEIGPSIDGNLLQSRLRELGYLD